MLSCLGSAAALVGILSSDSFSSVIVFQAFSMTASLSRIALFSVVSNEFLAFVAISVSDLLPSIMSFNKLLLLIKEFS
ncbi:hypothetical protein BDF14DRAFT_1849318 [Spinellus fusiger]|nr:hypothetical protein BDF14DRAFT_1849318 [Spinellus fusiger]